jgi:8-oxo-dGTP diphosphatase
MRGMTRHRGQAVRNKQLPDKMMITGCYDGSPAAFFDKLATALATTRVPLVQLRLKDIAETEYKILAREAIELCHRFDSRIILNTHIRLAEELNADGVHLTSELLKNFTRTDTVYPGSVSASCHNKEELIMAREKAIDFITLSPVLSPSYKPAASTLGWQTFSELLAHAHCPVFALGGLSLADLTQAKRMGAHGIASISSFWR